MNYIKNSLLALAMISAPLVGMDKEPIKLDVLDDIIRHLPADIKTKAFTHFVQTYTLLKGNITVNDVADLAKLYQREANKRFKKESPSEKN